MWSEIAAAVVSGVVVGVMTVSLQARNAKATERSARTDPPPVEEDHALRRAAALEALAVIATAEDALRFMPETDPTGSDQEVFLDRVVYPVSLALHRLAAFVPEAHWPGPELIGLLHRLGPGFRSRHGAVSVKAEQVLEHAWAVCYAVLDARALPDMPPHLWNERGPWGGTAAVDQGPAPEGFTDDPPF
ncbi:hypothetical protein [Streptodolium elevatio]|uniref:Uncharacterized protein n=1 Tax=Streptodolium elevatio TaxID=3157996 RepID=A0ABV3DKN1_9ACTN